MMKSFLNPEGHQNCISGSKVTIILPKRLILPIGGVALGRVCACSLRPALFGHIINTVLPDNAKTFILEEIKHNVEDDNWT